MNLLDVCSVNKYFGGRHLLENCTFSVGEGDHIGLVGVNGCGKTTLFKIITDSCEFESGTVVKSKGLRIGFMEQFIFTDSGLPAYDCVLEVFSDVAKMEAELEDLNRQIEQGGENLNALIERQHTLRERYEAEGGLTYKSRARSALLGLGFTEEQLTQSVGTLSGGQASKVQLAKLLLCGAQLLLLDEPTNHLDIKSSEWLESFLRSFSGAFIVISHDRYFLDSVCGKILGLENRKLTVYNGGYTAYLQKKRENTEIAARHYENQQRELSRLESSVATLRSFNREKSIKAAESKLKQIARLEKTMEKPESSPDELEFKFTVKTGGGNDVLSTDNLSLSYGSKEIFKDVNINIYKGERVFLIGSNGCGKTSLFKILTEAQAGTRGFYRYGSQIEWGYFDQTQEGLHLNNTVIEEIRDTYPKMTETQIRSALAAFLFKGEDVFALVSSLSGGERARLAILKLMLSQSNFLLLDEPTNHLDISSREALENALSSFEGTLFIISHDRYLINKLADKIYLMEDGKVTYFEGNYDYFLQHYAPPEEEQKKSAEKSAGADKYKLEKEQRSNRRKLINRLAKVEELIAGTEDEITSLEEQINLPENASDCEKLLELTELCAQKNSLLEELMEEWERLTIECQTD
ncbi:MAG: ATP-binding cassette domain-containing protein [Clostridia bacterium]|nr:ATP-binding cassette domain-containing protein [Clostridia bacterium]